MLAQSKMLFISARHVPKNGNKDPSPSHVSAAEYGLIGKIGMNGQKAKGENN